MATYMSFIKWTDQGINNAKDAPKRLDAFEAAVKGAGGKLKDVYLVTGEYDPSSSPRPPMMRSWPGSRWRRRCR